MEFDEQFQDIHEYLTSELELIFKRLEKLERSRGLSPLGFSAGAQFADPAERVAALMALANWRAARLESLYGVN